MSHQPPRERNPYRTGAPARKVAAGRAVPRGPRGLDSHTATQRRFCAFLALLLLNDSTRAHKAEADDLFTDNNHQTIAWWDLSGLEREDCSFATQRDEFTVLTDVPRRLADQMSVRLAGPRPRGVPGLRALAGHPEGLWFRFWHPPTHGLLQARSASLPMVRPYVTAARLPPATRTPPTPSRLVDVEQRALPVMSRMHPDAQHLLAGLLARLSPGDQTGFATTVSGSSSNWGAVRLWHSLWGTGLEWTLRGGSEIAAAGLAAALTDPMTGLDGASIVSYVDGVITVRWQWATLALIGKA